MGLVKDMSHLVRYYPKPEEGEEIPIQFIDLENKIAGWSPYLKRTVYVTDATDADELKRVREVTLLKVYNWLSNRESVIELSGPERSQFEEIMDDFTRHGGEIRYTRKNIYGRMVNYFRLKKSTMVGANVKEGLLVDKL